MGLRVTDDTAVGDVGDVWEWVVRENTRACALASKLQPAILIGRKYIHRWRPPGFANRLVLRAAPNMFLLSRTTRPPLRVT